MEHQEVDLSAIHQPILQLTTVTSVILASNTIGVKILGVFLQLTVLENIFALKINIILISVDRCT